MTNNTPALYAIAASVDTNGKDGYTGSRQIPTFYLDPRVQGILSEEAAEQVAYDILSAAGTNNARFHITAVAV